MLILSSGWSGSREGSDEFKCYDDADYNCMGLYDLHGRLTVSVLTYYIELAEIYGKINEERKSRANV